MLTVSMVASCVAMLGALSADARAEELADAATANLTPATTSVTNAGPIQAPKATEPTTAGLGFYTYSYLYAPNSGRNANFFSLTGFLRGDSQGSMLEAKGDFEGVAIVKPATTWTIEAPEAFLGTSPELSHDVSVKFGRELRHWSHLDEDFQMGIWQPRFRWDYVHPQTVGLTGLYVDVQEPYFQFTGFASPIFVPDRGIPIEFKNNGIYTIDPYFVSPATTLSFQGVPTKVTYGIEKPSMSKILFHPGAGALARVGQEHGPWGSAAYAIQPMNQLLFSYSGGYGLDSTEIDATLYPRVAYHRMLSLESGYEQRSFGFSISGLDDQPIDTAQILGQDTQVVTQAYSVSPAFEYRFGDLKYAPTRIRVAGLKTWGGNAPDSGQDATGAGSVFENRYFSHTAAVATGETPLHFVSTRLSGSCRLLWDIEHSGTIQSTDLYFLVQRSFMVNLGGDLLNSSEEPSAPDPISRYRANDRIRLGVTYVF